MAFNIEVTLDDGMYVATSEDIPGLATEAPTYEKLVERVRAVAPELMALNGVIIPENAVLSFNNLMVL